MSEAPQYNPATVVIDVPASVLTLINVRPASLANWLPFSA
jgi:hypothetical protein